MNSQTEKAARFAALHRRDGVFVMPNPWDAASARVLAARSATMTLTQARPMRKMMREKQFCSFLRVFFYNFSNPEAFYPPLKL